MRPDRLATMGDYPSERIDQRRVSAIDRRTFLAGVGATVGGVGLTAGPAAAQESQGQREMVIEEQGEPWAGNYEDQFVVVTYKPNHQTSPPDVISNCDVEWADQAVTYNGILVDRVSEDPKKTNVTVFTDGEASSIERGTPFRVTGVGDCGDTLVRLTGEPVPEAESGDTETTEAETTTAATETTAGTETTTDGEIGGGSLRTRELLIEEQGDPWTNNYAGQFVIVTYKPNDRPSPPQAISNCQVDWPVDESAMYKGLLIDNLREDPQKTEVDVFVDGTEEDIERGTPFIVSKTWPCEDEMIHLTGDAVPNAPSVEGQAGPGVENQNGSGDSNSGTGMPGFGALVGLGGIAGGTLLRALRSGGESDD